MAHKTKASPEVKVMLVKKYLAGKISVKEASRIVRVDEDFFRTWIRLYPPKGSLGLFNVGTNRRYRNELKTKAVEPYLAKEISQNEIFARYNIRSKKQVEGNEPIS